MKHLRNYLIKRKGLPSLITLEVPAQDQVTHCFGPQEKVVHHSGTDKANHLPAESGSRNNKSPFKGMLPLT
jgi:hypothetical protein